MSIFELYYHFLSIMAKKAKPRTHRQVRIEEQVVLKIVDLKAPGQSIGGYIKQLIIPKDGLSNPIANGKRQQP